MGNTFKAAEILMNRTLAALPAIKAEMAENTEKINRSMDMAERGFQAAIVLAKNAECLAARIADPNDLLDEGDLCQRCLAAVATKFLDAGDAEEGTGYHEDDLSCCEACYREVKRIPDWQKREAALEGDGDWEEYAEVNF